MPCPNCSHTLSLIAAVLTGRIYRWCERCGTIAVEDRSETTDVYTPKLVDRCRQYEKEVRTQDSGGYGAWNRLGIRESIRKPEDRQ